ncbi:MAG: HIT domain-containing protein [Pyrinomonadaceae bacterium]|nr:HIT domain-containing protein [Pyrinomonadaceae bacterium]
MIEDFYCDNVLSGRIEVERIHETANVLAFRHTRPFWEIHIVVIPKRHISSFLTLESSDDSLVLELLTAVRKVAGDVVDDCGAARILTNLGEYQESKHLHFHVYSGQRIRPDNPI